MGQLVFTVTCPDGRETDITGALEASYPGRTAGEVVAMLIKEIYSGYKVRTAGQVAQGIAFAEANAVTITPNALAKPA